MVGGAVPAATFAFIGGTGSNTLSISDGLYSGVRVVEEALRFDTPWGESPAFALLELQGRRVLHVRLHGWREGVSRGRASRQVFSVLHRAGVQRILGDAGVGSLNHLLDPGDLMIPNDYVDLTTDRDRGGMVVGDHLLVMRDPICPVCRQALSAAVVREAPDRRLFRRGVYVVTEGPRFESPAEVRRLRSYGDIVGQSMVPEVWLARDIGACYAGVYLVVNYGEGVVEEWSHDELARMYREDGASIGRIVLGALAALPPEGGCRCRDLRRPSLLL